MSEKTLSIFTDGAASENPDPASVGVVIKENDKTVVEISKSIGSATNNVAEYTAMIEALKEAVRLGAQKVILHTDSELLYYQLTGRYKVKNANLLLLFEQVRRIAAGIKDVEMKRIPREQNQDADRLAKKAIIKEQAKAVASALFRAGEESPSSKG